MISACTFRGGKDNPNLASSNFCTHAVKKKKKKKSTLILHYADTPFSLSLHFGRSHRGSLHPFNFPQTHNVSLYEGKITAALTDSGVQTCEMHCYKDLVNYLSFGMILAGIGQLVQHKKTQHSYGRHMGPSTVTWTITARLAWFLQEMPALLVPLLLMLTMHKPYSMGQCLLLGTFCTHYFQR